MATIQNNESCSHTIETGTKYGQITLLPGVNLAVPDEAWDAVKNHPIISHWIETRKIEVLSVEPTPKGELGGMEVTELKATDEPIPIANAGINNQPPDPIPAVEEFKRKNKKTVEPES